jgi:NAD(P)-dependent dehydrogenase (short-subunit alcohol dehydrogenase family)
LSRIDGAARLAGRRAFVSGAGSGIGRSAALRLAAEGADVAVADLRPALADEVASVITDAGGRAIAIEADVASEQSVVDAVAVAADRFGGLDALVTCAGILHAGPTHETDLELWELTLRVNLTGTFLVLRHGIPHLLDAGGGAIVTIGSVASLVAGGYSSSYDASKGGVLQLTRAIAVEYADRGIRANCVCPGAVTTSLKAHSEAAVGTRPGTGTRPSPPKRVDVPMSRHADPMEIAAVVAFLCSHDASFLTGAAVPVDGGHTAV